MFSSGDYHSNCGSLCVVNEAYYMHKYFAIIIIPVVLDLKILIILAIYFTTKV